LLALEIAIQVCNTNIGVSLLESVLSFLIGVFLKVGSQIFDNNGSNDCLPGPWNTWTKKCLAFGLQPSLVFL
jgi:hypothetical protein